jgi:hypothetical protein
MSYLHRLASSMICHDMALVIISHGASSGISSSDNLGIHDCHGRDAQTSRSISSEVYCTVQYIRAARFDLALRSSRVVIVVVIHMQGSSLFPTTAAVKKPGVLLALGGYQIARACLWLEILTYV